MRTIITNLSVAHQTGDTSNYEHRGVAPRSINALFSEINARIEIEYTVTCTYMEIYNERIFDLLADLASPDVPQDYAIVEEKGSKGTFVRGLAEIEVKSENEALNLMFSGELTRTTAQHKLNRRSNRSHSIFTMYVQQRQRSGISERVVHSKLHLVDLAGSERLKKTMDAMETIAGSDVTKKESMSINQSLSYLEQCVVALARKSNHIPFRQSKLTNILKDCLGANCSTVMLACIWGEADHLEETISTLRLAARMMRVQNETSSIETVDPAALIKKQAKQIRQLKQELLMHDSLADRSNVKYDAFNAEQQASVLQMVERYIAASPEEEEDALSITTYRTMLEVCKQFKRIVVKARVEPRGGTRAVTADGRAAGGSLDGPEAHDETGARVGEPVSGRGFSLGVAPLDSRPPFIEGAEKFARSPARGAPCPGSKSPAKVDFADIQSTLGGADSRVESSGQRLLFEAFTREEGRETYERFVGSKAALREHRSRARELATAVNDAKADIDILIKQIDIRKHSRIELLRKSGLKVSETEDIVDEEEFALMKELREAKRAYKNGFEQLQRTRQGMDAAQHAVDDLKNEIAAGFVAWNSAGHAEGEPADKLDDQEAFDKLEMERVMQSDPDSYAFFNAQKTKRAHMTQHGTNIRQILKNKRN